jgi:signal transduction histidine kinase/ActR/RegA family two-component response regulator
VIESLPVMPVRRSIATRMLRIVLGIYLAIAAIVGLSQLLITYRLQKAAILKDFEAIESAFGDALGVSLYHMDEEALVAAVEGILQMQAVVGMKILNAKREEIVVGGDVLVNDEFGAFELSVNMLGPTQRELSDPGEHAGHGKLFQHAFTIDYVSGQTSVAQGDVTLYSGPSVIFRRMIPEVLMVAATVGITLLTFLAALLWSVNRYLRRPLGVLTRAAAGISLGNLGEFSVDSGSTRHDEIKQLADTMTSMANDLNDAVGKQQELQVMLADAQRRESLAVLAGGVAHDLNNILGPIVILPEIISDILCKSASMTPEDVTEIKECLGLIEDSASRAVGVIGDLKSLGQRGHVELHPADVNGLVRNYLETADIASLREQYPDVTISHKLQQQELFIRGDVTDLNRIFLNIVANGAQSVSGRGEVQVETADVSLGAPKLGYEAIDAGHYVVIRIQDTGSGIDERVARKIFEPFVTTKQGPDGRHGSGLGLSVVHSIMKDHGGFIDVESPAGAWSTRFSLYFPAVNSNDQAECPSGEEPTPSHARNHHVLVVDDDSGQRSVAVRCLKKLGYVVEEAESGQAAVQRFETQVASDAPGGRFDLVVLDMVMEEGFDGLDTYRSLLEMDAGIKVLIVSGHAQNDRVAAALKLGAGWLPKPYDLAAFDQAVRSRLTVADG